MFYGILIIFDMFNMNLRFFMKEVNLDIVWFNYVMKLNF